MGLGKTILIRVAAGGDFSVHHDATVGLRAEQVCHCRSGGQVNFAIWDTPGNSAAFPLSKATVRGCAVVVIVASAIDEATIETIREYRTEVLRLSEEPGNFVYAINKWDLVDDEITAEGRIAEMLPAEETPVHFVSAKTGIGVAELSREIGEPALRRAGLQYPQNVLSSESGSKSDCC